MPEKHILVLGASGFIGSPLLDHLAQDSSNRITVLQHKHAIARQGVQSITGSLTQVNWDFLRRDPPDVIFHLARINARKGGALSRWFAAMRGRRANQRLIGVLNTLNKPVKVVYVSGSLMYGEGKNHVETDPLQPVSFARQYHLAESPWLPEQPYPNIDITLVRVPWVLGFGSWFQAYYHRVIRGQKKIPVYSTPDFLMHFITVQQAATAITEASKITGVPVLNLFAGDPVSHQRFMAILAAAYACNDFEHYTPDQLQQRFGRATREAFTREITLGTVYPQLLPQLGLAGINAEAVVKEMLSRFAENK